MKKFIGKFLAVAVLATVVAAPTVFAQDLKYNSNTSCEVEAFEKLMALNEEFNPMLNISRGRFTLNSNWITIATQNNVGPADIRVTNYIQNRGDIQARVVRSSNGEEVVRATTIPLGSTVTIGRVPAFSGTYRLEVRSLTGLSNAEYTLSASDRPWARDYDYN